jgi:hypothetical protein
MNKTKILFLASNPLNTDAIALDEEARSIGIKIRESEFRDSIEFVTSWAVRPTDLLTELSIHKPTIMHFSGHGSGEDGLILTDDRGESKLVSTDALKALFSSFKDTIQLVVLNACLSEVQGHAISKVIDCVIGMKKSIGDKAAISFAAFLYSALGFGRSVKDAFEQGRVALMLEGIPEADTPVLLTRKGIEAGSIFLIKVDPRPQDLIDVYLYLAREINALGTKIQGAPTSRKEAIAKYYQKISNTLRHAESELRDNRVPHGDCDRILEYAEQLPGAIGDLVGMNTATGLSMRLKEAFRIEGMLYSLYNLPGSEDREERLRDLGKAAAYFEVSADSLLVSG